jgi:hypothetical protein
MAEVKHHVACITQVTGGLEGPCDCGAEARTSNLRVIEPFRSRDGVEAEVFVSGIGAAPIVVIKANTDAGEDAETVLNVHEARDLMLWLQCALGLPAVETTAGRSVESLTNWPRASERPLSVDPILGTGKQITDEQLKSKIAFANEDTDYRAFVELWERRSSPVEPESPICAASPTGHCVDPAQCAGKQICIERAAVKATEPPPVDNDHVAPGCEQFTSPAPDYREIAHEALEIAAKAVMTGGCHCYDDHLERLRTQVNGSEKQT